MRGHNALTLGVLLSGAAAALAQLPNVVWEQNSGGNVVTVDFSTSGKLVASGISDGAPSAQLWRASDGQLLAEFPNQLSGVTQVSISPDDRYLAVGAITPDFYHPVIRTNVYDIGSGDVVRTYSGVRNAWSADGTFIATAGGAFYRHVDVDNFVTGVRLAHINTGGYVGGLALAADGSFVVTGNFSDGSVSIWDVASGQRLHLLTGHAAGVSALALSPDMQLIASGSADPNIESVIKIWRVADGALLYTLTGHHARVSSLAFSPDGRKVLSCGQESYVGGPYSVRLWDADDGTMLDSFQYDGGAYGLFAVDYAGDGSAIALGQGSDYVTVALPPRGVVGDMNCDGRVDFADINPFVLALGGQAGYAAQFPACDVKNADIDRDGAVTFKDVNPFVAVLSGR